MFILRVALALALLSESNAALPDVVSCTYMEYYCSARNCTTIFVKGVQKEPIGNCSVKYNQMVSCVVKTLKICQGDLLTDSLFEEVVRRNFNEDELCSDGGLEVPTMPPVNASICRPPFRSDANACVKTFHEKYAANKSDPSLCMENAKAKQCMKETIAFYCNFSSAIQEMIDLDFGDHNPYCANNRDPGAIGNDQCHGVKEPRKRSVSAGLKSSVSRALLFSLVLLLLFVKI